MYLSARLWGKASYFLTPDWDASSKAATLSPKKEEIATASCLADSQPRGQQEEGAGIARVPPSTCRTVGNKGVGSPACMKTAFESWDASLVSVSALSPYHCPIYSPSVLDLSCPLSGPYGVSQPSPGKS